MPRAIQALVVDDEPLILLHAAEILEDAGFNTLTRLSAEEAIETLKALDGQLSLLFTDVEMSGKLDGFALARFTANRWPSVSILVASGNRAPQLDEMPMGAVFVAKPFSAEIIHSRLHEILPEDRKPRPLRKS